MIAENRPWKELDTICGTHSVSRETFDALDWYAKEIAIWQPRMNLISSGDLSAIWSRHILDSAQVLPLGLERGITHWVDLGSGAGFPGLVLGILLKEGESGSVTLIESNAKKCTFLRHCARVLSLPTTVIQGRIDATTAEIVGSSTCITSRALASLDRLFAYAEPWLSGGALGLFHKGSTVDEECAEASKLWNFEANYHKSLSSASGCILEVRNLRRKQ